MPADPMTDRLLQITEGEQPTGVSGRTTLLVVVAVLVAVVVLYELLNWQPVNAPQQYRSARVEQPAR